MSDPDRPHLARLIDDAMNERGWSAREVSTKSREHDPARRGVNHGTVADIRDGSWGPKGPTQRTLHLLAQTLNIDTKKVLEAAGRSPAQPRIMPDDFLYLTPEQWAIVREVARQFRIANEAVAGINIDTGIRPTGSRSTSSDN